MFILFIIGKKSLDQYALVIFFFLWIINKKMSGEPCTTPSPPPKLIYYILGVASKQLRLLHGRVGDSTTVENSMSPQISELVEDAIASWCSDIDGHFWLVRNGVKKLVKLKFEFFSCNTFDVSQIFWQRVVQLRTKYSYCILLKGLCWVSVCWILKNALCSMPWMFPGFYCVPSCAINIWHHMLCYLPNIYNYITFMASLERVQFEFAQSFPVV